MAPVTVDTVEKSLQAIIQDLYEMSTCIYGYASASTTGPALTSKTRTLVSHLLALSSTAPAVHMPIPPEVLEYVESGRNPDIYTREFVETVQKSNEYLAGKSRAFAQFRDVLAQEISSARPELAKEVGRVLDGAAVADRDLVRSGSDLVPPVAGTEAGVGGGVGVREGGAASSSVPPAASGGSGSRDGGVDKGGAESC
ncbi:MAG: RNA polymerase II mediator complex subunit [Thelocarpon superellum]|nr:MAG: RNA polymerase II mediator complex subunit [Thelocarpon superellum]